MFFGPLLLATWLYFGGASFRPAGKTNHGQLLEPLVNIGDVLPEAATNAYNAGHWMLLYANSGNCDGSCEFALYTLRQSRLMLGREMERLVRVFLHGESAPDTVFLADEHAGLVALRDDSLSALLDRQRPAQLAGGGYFLVDPLGNIVLYFRPDIDPGDMVDDIERLLKLSAIG